jgi:predicted Rossmann fold nucleotide-binding protein DprA/Smf involved in DNA uptake
MEQECLRILLRSPSQVTWCLARGEFTRIPPELKKPVADGQLRILTPFPETVRRVTTATSERRNRLVADMAAAIIVVHAAPGSKIERLSTELLAAGKPLFTFDHPANSALIQAGARMVRLDIDWNKIVAALRPTHGRAQT